MKKRILILMTMVSIIIFSTSVLAIEGEGTEESPFLITNEEELKLIYDFPDCNFKLINDIILSSSFWYNDSVFYGILDGNNYQIKNYLGYSLIKENYGVIQNLTICRRTDIGTVMESSFKGLICNTNETSGKIINSFTYGQVSATGSAGGLVGYNYGTIDRCGNYANVYSSSDGGTSRTNQTTTKSYAAGFVYYNSGNITNSFAICNVDAHAYSYYWRSQAYASGFVYENRGKISNCFSVSKTTGTSSYGYGGTSNSSLSPFISVNTGSVSNCFYDNSNSATNLTEGVTAKSTLAMKMKKTYIDADWNFDNVWGISPDINDGYPYLLWEYTALESSSSTDIIGATSTNNSLKFISKVTTDDKSEISSFGTAFIPLHLFENFETRNVTVEYDNTDYNISDSQTYGATLRNIPSTYKNTYILGKSFIKNSDGSYVWSESKYASINDVHMSEQIAFNGHTYKLFKDSLNWDEAKEYCERLGGHLVTITSSEEQTFIENNFCGDYWIGGYRDDNFIWYWVTDEPWQYTNWGEGEPNNSSNVIPNEKYACVWPKKWNDLANNSREQSGFICEWEI